MDSEKGSSATDTENGSSATDAENESSATDAENGSSATDTEKGPPAADTETESVEEIIEKIKIEQGCHECEITARGEESEGGDLHKTLMLCDKNSGHINFIPNKTFRIEQLPLSYRIPEVFDFVKVFADLTVQIKVNYTSDQRPEFYPLSNDKEPYPAYNLRGQDIERHGTGWLRDVINFNEEVKQLENMEDKTCPCIDCSNSESPKKYWGELFIRTARHVCFDTSEVARSLCRFFYDDPKDESKVVEVKGLKAGIGIDTRKDFVEMWCYTHDTNLAGKLAEMVEQRTRLQSEVNEIYQNSLHSHRLVVIASHPHGKNKQITIGEWKGPVPVVMDYTEYQYTADTCPGSSGAPVFILGRLAGWWYHQHRGWCEDRVHNRSGAWLD